jgi:hypothetical protein
MVLPETLDGVEDYASFAKVVYEEHKHDRVGDFPQGA